MFTVDVKQQYNQSLRLMSSANFPPIVAWNLGFLTYQGQTSVLDNRPNVGFLVHKDMGSAVLGCQPVSSRLISIRLRTAPFNVTIIQVYAPTSGHDDNEVHNFYRQLQEIIDQTPKKDNLVVQRDWNAKVGRDIQAD